MDSLRSVCPVCRMPQNTLCRNPDDSVRNRVHPRRLVAYLAYEAILGLAHRVPYSQRWDLTREILQGPDESAPPNVGTAGGPAAAEHELNDLSAVMDAMIGQISHSRHGWGDSDLVRRLKAVRSRCEHYSSVLAQAQAEGFLDPEATPDLRTVGHQLRVYRARRVRTDLITVAGPQPPKGAPEWRVKYRQNGTFRLQRTTPPLTGELGEQLTHAWGCAPTSGAAQRAAAHLVGADDNRVIVRGARSGVDEPISELGSDLPPSNDRVWHLLDEDDEPAYQVFLEDCEKRGTELAQIENLPTWLKERAQTLNATHPQCPPHWLNISPSHHPNEDHTLTHMEAVTWVPTHQIVATHLGRWDQHSDHKSWQPSDIAHSLMEAAEQGTAAALAAELFRDEPMQLTRINAWAGPVYVVGEFGEGQHRAHTLRTLGLPWAAAHITYPVPHPQVDLYGLVGDDEEQDRQRRAPVERARERAVLIDGLIDRGVIEAWWDTERTDWLWCRSLPAPWLLRNAVQATAANRTYEAAYSGALARLGIPEQVGCDAAAWTAWLTNSGSARRTTEE